LIQVIKEGIGTKGPTLSTYISIPGRYLVVMPGLSRIGVSRKIGDDQQRRRLRGILQDLQPPRGLGFIIRTAGLDRTKKELQRDLAYLTRLWRVIANRIKKGKGPAPIYQESDIITRTIRDIFTNEIEKIRVDEPVSYSHAREFMDFVMPRYADRLVLEQGLEPIFHRFGIEAEIGNMQHKRVPLANGGSLVIDQTEAMVAIDVNSGQFRQESDAEENAFQMNLAAAKEVARQLRLRDLGGVVVIDFIDMRDERHRFEIERALRLAVSRDRARTKVLRMSQFGIIQMTRQRIRPSLKRTSFDECPACRATGLVKTGETMSIEAMRLLQLAAWRPNVARVRVRAADNVAQFLLNRKRKEIAKLEDDGNIQVTIFGVPGVMPETLEVQCLDSSGGEIRLTHETKSKRANGK
jgi:ribonuclease E